MILEFPPYLGNVYMYPCLEKKIKIKEQSFKGDIAL